MIGIAKLPKESVVLLELGVIDWPECEGLRVEPADDLPVGRVARGLVDNRDPGVAAEPGDLAQAVDGRRGGRDERGAVGRGPGRCRSGRTGPAGEQHRRQVDGEFALAVGGGQQQVGVRGGRGIGRGEALQAAGRRVGREGDGAGRTVDGQDRRAGRDAGAGNDSRRAARSVMVVMPRTVSDPLASVPVKPKVW